MPGITKTRYNVTVKLNGTEEEPYNKFQIQYAVTETVDATGDAKKDESDRTLVHPSFLGLNPDWLRTKYAPVHRALNRERKAEIRELHLKSPYWGHLIYNSVQQFNASNIRRSRKLVYDLRHGEADHNAWKSLFQKIDPLLWTKNPEHKRQPIIEYKGKQYCIIDPPLTKRGEQQAINAKKEFLRLGKYMFPMPNRAYISPLLRTLQTFEHSLKKIVTAPGDCLILPRLREQETGNCADILFDEYISKQKIPPKAGTDGGAWYVETTDEVRQRAASLHRDISRMDDSDCIVRVTHSLLIQNNLMGLEDGNGKVLQKFMLAECGLFAYVIEEDRPDKKVAEKLRKGLKRFVHCEKPMKRRRPTAFPDLKAPITPVAVTIERAILAV